MKRSVYFIFSLSLGISLVSLLAGCANIKTCKQMQSDIDMLQDQLLLCRKKQNETSALSEQLQRNLSLIQDKVTHLDERMKNLAVQEPGEKISLPNKIDTIDQQAPSSQQSEISVKEAAPKATPLESQEVVHNQDSHSDADLYRQSLADLRRGDIESAMKGFQKYVEAFPDTSLSDNALYWLAECLYRQNKYKLAAENFQKVIDNYPTGNKVPAATLKLGYSSFNIRDYDTSLSVFKTLIGQYPKSEEAGLAKKMVVKINSLLNGPTNK